jgi:hypothetical protein
MISGIEFLKIKDYYHPARITPLVIWLIVAFMISIFTAAFLILTGTAVHRRLRRDTRRKVILRPRETGINVASADAVTVVNASTQVS